MTDKSFNLASDPWIKVIDDQNSEQVVSLNDLFQNAVHYRQLAGEMKSQDLAILRFILAILTTVYSRYDAHDQPYNWIEMDSDTMRPLSFDDYQMGGEEPENDLLDTWQLLYKAKSFSKIVFQYLNCYEDHFDLFNVDTPFYQVTREQYDALVPANKSVKKGKGTVAIKQINRTISESNNKPDVFSPSSCTHKDDMSLAELVRWLIAYQNYTAVTDKTKVNAKDKFSVAKGWLYGLNPVFVRGKNIFETLMLNLVLVPQHLNFSKKLVDQKPVWEFPVESYAQSRIDDLFPQNLAQLYTIWSRIIHIEWHNGQPTIFSAGLPKLDNEHAFLEPMTTWKNDKKNQEVKPAQRWLNSLGKAMWRSFGQYVALDYHNGSADDNEPGIVSWMRLLKSRHYLNHDYSIRLVTAGLINDGNATSQSPAAEFADDMQIRADVLFDNDPSKQDYWPKGIEAVIQLTDKLGSLLWHFANNAGKLRGLSDSSDYANKITARYYEQLNNPFYEWLASLTNEDDRQQKMAEWKDIAKHIVISTAKRLLNAATPQELKGKSVDDSDDIKNIFVYYRIFRISVTKSLKS